MDTQISTHTQITPYSQTQYLHIHSYTHIFTQTFSPIYSYTYFQIQISTFSPTDTYIFTCTKKYIHFHTHPDNPIFLHTHKFHTQTQVHTYFQTDIFHPYTPIFKHRYRYFNPHTHIYIFGYIFLYMYIRTQPNQDIKDKLLMFRYLFRFWQVGPELSSTFLYFLFICIFF